MRQQITAERLVRLVPVPRRRRHAGEPTLPPRGRAYGGGRDIVVIGSLSLVHALAAADLVDEYRLITFPTVVGEGDRLFARGMPADFRFTAVEPAGAAALTVLRRDRAEGAR